MSTNSYTVFGSREVEAKIETIVADVGGVVAREMEPSQYRALVLIGGYGRGEGGVEIRDDGEYPHNNLDFLLISTGADADRNARDKDRLSLALEPLRSLHDIGIDIGVVSETAVRKSPCLVMWYDMRFGHRTVIGDEAFVPSLSRFSVERIPSWDVSNLLVNRGTLLVINDLLLEKGTWSTRVARTVIRHAMKAIIGYGDALLYFNGRYHWSYVEKQSRMQRLASAPECFRRLYDGAIEFRFRPDYAGYLDYDLPRWLEDLRAALADVHLTCERSRLDRPGLQWELYIETALRQALRDDNTSPRRLARKLVNAVRRPAVELDVSAIAHLGARAAGPRGLLPVLFPAVAYEKVTPVLSRAMPDFGGSRSAIRRRYLELWGQHVDINFTFPGQDVERTDDGARKAA